MSSEHRSGPAALPTADAKAWGYDWVARRMPGAIYRCSADAALTMLALTDRIELLTGYPATALVANSEHSYASLVHPDDRDLVIQAMLAVATRGEPRALEYRLRHRDGHEL